MNIAKNYASLVNDKSIADEFFKIFYDEYALTVEAVLTITEQTELLENDPFLKSSIIFRNHMIKPAHDLQVDILKEIRKVTDEKLGNKLKTSLLLSINCIAAALKNTG
jgi:phosphoenolpyruvate carboxylase